MKPALNIKPDTQVGDMFIIGSASHTTNSQISCYKKININR